MNETDLISFFFSKIYLLMKAKNTNKNSSWFKIDVSNLVNFCRFLLPCLNVENVVLNVFRYKRFNDLESSFTLVNLIKAWGQTP